MAKTFAGNRLRRLREERGISQIELARQLAISPSYLNQIEHDTRPLTVPVLIRITEMFGVDTTYFAPHEEAIVPVSPFVAREKAATEPPTCWRRG